MTELSHSSIAVQSRLRLEALLMKDGDPNEVALEVHAASDETLQLFGLKAYRINLMSLFGETWLPERILVAARKATISKMLGGWEYHHHYLPALRSRPDQPRIEDVPYDAIATALDKGRGLVIMSFHIGHMRYLASDIAHAGFEICAPLAGDAFANYTTAQAANPASALWDVFKFHNVEAPTGAIALARTLAKGGCIFSTIDGNTGLDGPQGDQQRAEVDILGVKANVKIGLFSLAARFGAPILVVASHSDGNRRVCRVGPSIDPKSRLSGKVKDRFVATSAQAVYSFFAEMLEQHPDDWCGGDLFHQWRIPSRSLCLDPERVERSLSDILKQGGQLTLNQRRIVPLHSGDDMVWSDAKTGSCYRMPSDLKGLVHRLAEPRLGVDCDWLDSQPDAARSRMWDLICNLASRMAVVEAACCEEPPAKLEAV